MSTGRINSCISEWVDTINNVKTIEELGSEMTPLKIDPDLDRMFLASMKQHAIQFIQSSIEKDECLARSVAVSRIGIEILPSTLIERILGFRNAVVICTAALVSHRFRQIVTDGRKRLFKSVKITLPRSRPDRRRYINQRDYRRLAAKCNFAVEIDDSENHFLLERQITMSRSRLTKRFLQSLHLFMDCCTCEVTIDEREEDKDVLALNHPIGRLITSNAHHLVLTDEWTVSDFPPFGVKAKKITAPACLVEDAKYQQLFPDVSAIRIWGATSPTKFCWGQELVHEVSWKLDWNKKRRSDKAVKLIESLQDPKNKSLLPNLSKTVFSCRVDGKWIDPSQISSTFVSRLESVPASFWDDVTIKFNVEKALSTSEWRDEGTCDLLRSLLLSGSVISDSTTLRVNVEHYEDWWDEDDRYSS